MHVIALVLNVLESLDQLSAAASIDPGALVLEGWGPWALPTSHRPGPIWQTPKCPKVDFVAVDASMLSLSETCMHVGSPCSMEWDIGESKLSMHGLCMGNAFHFMRNEVNGFLSTHELMHQLVKKQVLTHLLLNFFSFFATAIFNGLCCCLLSARCSNTQH